MDLTAPKWSYAGGVVKVEPKAEIIKRLGRSPDLADATVYSTLLPLGHRGRERLPALKREPPPRRRPAGFYL